MANGLGDQEGYRLLLGALSPPAAAALALCRSLSPGTGDDWFISRL